MQRAYIRERKVHMAIYKNRPRVRADDTLTLDAIKLRHNGVNVYLSKMSVHNLERYTKIDRWSPEKSASDENQGYQRPADKIRVRKMAKYVERELDAGRKPLLPTAVVLSARGCGLETMDGTITVTRGKKLRVIDGQHRREGLLYAANERGIEQARDLELPVVIIDGLNRVDEMRQFKTINSTAKSVRTDLVSMLLANLSVHEGEDALDASEKVQASAAKAIEKLNTDPKSPWYRRITMPNEVASELQVTKATTMLASIKPIRQFFVDGLGQRFTTTEREAEAIAGPVKEFWTAVQKLLPQCWEQPEDYVLLKVQGVFSLNIICRKVMRELFRNGEPWTAKGFRAYLQRSESLTNAEFWHVGDATLDVEPGGATGYGGMSGFSQLAELLWTEIEPDAT